ncbi:MAG: hypothetical protein PVJ11_16160, partial [Syntrophobacterales bacterium]
MRPTLLIRMRSGAGNQSLAELVTLVLITLFILAACAKEDDTEQIRELIKEGARLAEEHNISGLLKLTSEDFVARPGNHDDREVKGILWYAFNRYGHFKVMYPEPSVDLEESGRAASAKVYFMIVQKERSIPELKDLYKDPRGWLEEVGETADLYRLKLELLKKNEDWLVRSALLEPFRGVGF